jgi:hypothetical protein
MTSTTASVDKPPRFIVYLGARTGLHQLSSSMLTRETELGNLIGPTVRLWRSDEQYGNHPQFFCISTEKSGIAIDLSVPRVKPAIAPSFFCTQTELTFFFSLLEFLVSGQVIKRPIHESIIFHKRTS